MALLKHLTLTGETQGAIQGSSTMQGREGTIEVEALDQNLEIPADIQTGLSTGKRRHLPLRIMKKIDKASPKLFQACCTGEHMKDVTIKFFRISPKGQEEQFFTITLNNAIIIKFHEYMLNALDPHYTNREDEEEILFTFEKIRLTWNPDGIEAEDSWQVPK